MRSPSGSSFPLRSILDGREERAEVRERLLRGHPLVLSLGINLPGWPKILPGDREALEAARAALTDRLGPASEALYLENGAGRTLLIAWDRSRGAEIAPSYRRIGEAAKRSALELEETLPFGRALDLDVWTRGGALGRGDLGLPPRRCLLCGEEAKICARMGGHPLEALRLEAARLLALAIPSSPG